jgi:hypothetical protein
MGEITYRGEPPFYLPTQAASVRGDKGTVVVTVFASVAGKGPSDVPVHFGMPIDDARRLVTDLRRCLRLRSGGNSHEGGSPECPGARCAF